MKFFSFNKNIVSIDIGSYETKVISGSIGRDGITVNKAFSFLTPAASYENGRIKNQYLLNGSLKDELRENKIPTNTCHLNIKSTGIITREIPFPNLSNKEIEGLLRYQLTEYLPMDYSQYIIQHKIIGKITDEGVEKLNVLVVAIPKDIVDMHYDLVREVGLRPSVMDYQSNALWKLFKYIDLVNGEIKPDEKTIGVFDLGHNSTNLTIISKGNVQISRVIETGELSKDADEENLFAMNYERLQSDKPNLQDISFLEGEYSLDDKHTNMVKTTIDGMMEKADRVFKYYISKEADNEIDKIILYGGLSNIKGIDRLFSNYFEIATTILETVSKVNMESNINKYINCISALIRDDEV